MTSKKLAMCAKYISTCYLRAFWGKKEDITEKDHTYSNPPHPLLWDNPPRHHIEQTRGRTSEGGSAHSEFGQGDKVLYTHKMTRVSSQ